MTQGQFPEENGEDGEFERQEDSFREIIQDRAESGRYHLYVSLACPWAHRTLITRKWLGLEDSVSVGIVDPVRDERGWAFRPGNGHGPDELNGFQFLSEAYRASNPAFHGRVTVPVLWDKQERRIVNNSEDDICLMFQKAFAASDAPDLFPGDVEEDQAELSKFLYDHVNNGVYRAGFATRQPAYERAVKKLFAALDTLDDRLTSRRYLFGDRITESDWRLFCTLIRFDAVYHGHFKCNLRRIIDYPNLDGYLRDLYQQPGIADTVNLDHIKRHYYITHDDINPTGIVPLGPILDFNAPHGRESR
ncbi:glutathione S-transferase family protein [Luteolibacter ambystomatis]|uniref:Glutathione S-transferase family protein n=1 Tax=Luteolibacter ambystomatis TaxID=2824561 RepID=A0A975J1T1_9BACT|nr:glutathione S-transferase family protein [Luteolibacter ambystomatis]QUE52460.1 glutathione S-transferase family protein [Luteolibacter ambystomatis]